jgi:hypothetical protein
MVFEKKLHSEIFTGSSGKNMSQKKKKAAGKEVWRCKRRE